MAETGTDQRGVNQLRVGVQGMTCASCVARVERALNQLDGVQEATVNLATEKASVSFDPEKVTVPALLEAVTERGYTPVTVGASFSVEGMTCASCVGRVERALQKTNGVVGRQRQSGDRKGQRHLLAGRGEPGSAGRRVFAGPVTRSGAKPPAKTLPTPNVRRATVSCATSKQTSR